MSLIAFVIDSIGQLNDMLINDAILIFRKILFCIIRFIPYKLCQFHSYRHFFLQYPSSSTRSKLLGSSRYSLNYQHHISSKFTSLVYFKLATLVHRSPHNADPQYMSSLLHPYMPFYQLRSASLNLLSQPRIKFTLCLSWFSTC